MPSFSAAIRPMVRPPLPNSRLMVMILLPISVPPLNEQTLLIRRFFLMRYGFVPVYFHAQYNRIRQFCQGGQRQNARVTHE